MEQTRDKDDSDQARAFIARWKGVTASELSTSQSFLIELCELLDVPRPHPTPEQDYLFERPITFNHADGSSSPGRVDLYRRGAFVLESKKIKAGAHTRSFDEAMLRAHAQAQNYARALPASEGRPPFLVVVDVGHRIELYSEFSRSGGSYVPFPDPRNHRIALHDLADPAIRERLRSVWLDPLSLDPSRESARVTREIAARLAELAKSLERSGHTPEAVAQFLMRCLFTMFAEDVHLLPSESFRNLLITYREQSETAMRMLAQLWRDMDGGGFSAVLAREVLRFNGKLFKQPDTLPLNTAQIDLLIAAARADWKYVEPAIFGTLLERALSPEDRHKLGAHYTPRAYVERLVLPTVIEPLRREWSDAHAAALILAAEGKDADAVTQLLRFHHRLCSVRVLDPACGSGNFLYVTLEHLKRLEGEVLNALDELGYRQGALAIDGERADAQAAETVDPHNLLGIELNPRAAAIAEVVLWIGYLQWHFRTRGDVSPPVPVIRDFRNIENRDAVLARESVEIVVDEHGVPVTHWDGVTMKPSPVTGEPIPDEAACVALERYVNPRKAEWPRADFVVGNPPYIGARRIRLALGDGYLDALRTTYPDVPEHADLVMYWWARAAELVGRGAIERFGFITSNSIRQTFSRKVMETALSDYPGIGIRFAIPDHPWVDTADGAAVRVAMTVVDASGRNGQLLEVTGESPGADGEVGVELRRSEGLLTPNLTIGFDPAATRALRANNGMACVGYQLTGKGFVLDEFELAALYPDRDWPRDIVRPLLSGRDITQRIRALHAIDLFGLTASEVRARHPVLFQWVLDRVKPERDQNKDAPSRENWWLFARPRAEFRPALAGTSHAMATSLTAKHRSFVRVPAGTICDSTTVMFALPDALHLGVLSSIVHVTWALAAGGRLGVGNDPRYNKSRCFEPFPFPDPGPEQAGKIRALAEQLDAHRKRALNPGPAAGVGGENSGLTLTGMYNVLEKLRSGEPLTAKERSIHEQGLVSVLRQLHDELDAAVLEAYGWPDLLALLGDARGNDNLGEGRTRDEARRDFEEALLARLVALNAERAAEEARGLIRWLRPEFQNPQTAPEQQQVGLDSDARDDVDGATTRSAATLKPTPWPRDTVDQIRAVADLVAASPVPLSLDDIAARFSGRGPWKKRLPQLLGMLVALGRANEQQGRFGA